MGLTYVKDEVDGWKPAIPFVHTSSGWARAKIAYRKTSSTVWTPFFTIDNTMPGVPTVTMNQIDNKIWVTVKAPLSSDIKSVRVKVGKNPSLNNSTDANYVAPAHGNDDHWSDWLIKPNETRSKSYPLAGSLTNGQTYVVTAWSEDMSRNFSTAVSASLKYVVKPITVINRQTTYVSSVGSNTWRLSTGQYLNDGLLRTGNVYNQHSRWYYSTKLAAALSKSKYVNSVKIQVQRLNSQVAGVSLTDSGNTAAVTRFHLFAHKLPGAIPLDPQPYNHYVDPIAYDFAQGQTRTLPIPEKWWDEICSGYIRGFGIFSQQSTGSTLYTGTYYGFPTASGRVFLDWSI